MKTASAVAMVLDVTCPYCTEPVECPKTGSYMITSDTFTGDVGTCGTCGKTFKMPVKAHVFVKRY